MTVKSKLDAIATTTDWLKGAIVANERTLVNLDGQVKTSVSAIEALKNNQTELASATSALKTKLDAIHADLLGKTNEILTRMNSLVTVQKPKV
jgi:predicted  nucleic acid-binding Zn-ribbon protein